MDVGSSSTKKSLRDVDSGVEVKGLVVDVLAADILSDRKLFTIFTYLIDGVYGSQLAGKVPQTTAYRLLRRLARAGVAEVASGIDRRKKFYRLSRLGEEVLHRVRVAVTRALGARKEEDAYVADEKAFQALATKLGISTDTLAKLLNASISSESTSYVKYYVWKL